MNVRKQEETPEGYLARARAVFKIGRPCGCQPGCPSNDLPPWRPASLGEFLHRADVEGC